MGKIVKLVATAGAFIVGGPQAAAAVGAGLTALGIGNPKKPKISQAAVDRQNVSINPTAPRTMIFGRTAMATDLRYQSYTGSNQEFYNQIIVCAAHKVTSIEELWIGDQQAWTVGGGVIAPFIGYLDVTPVLEGSAANMVNVDGVWNAANNRRLTGCAYMWIQYKRTGNSKKSESPFASDITSRLTIIGKGMPLYCPRRDSTVPGGSGTMRLNDQSTWAFAVGVDEIGRNPALVELAYKIGWRIGGVVSVGRGMPSRRISLPSYIAAANLCDESVSISGGTTEPRYRLDGIYDESQGGLEVLGAIHATMDARHRDDGGQLSLHVMHNDISTPTLTFTDDDILGPLDWDVWPLSIEEDRNIGRGRFTDARPNSLYQLSDFGEIVSTSIDGNDRILSEDFAEVQSASQARRLVRRKLQRLKFPGIMSFEAGARAYAVKVGDPVWLSFPNLAMVNKRFRVRSRSVTLSARVDIILSEEDAAIYPTAAEDGAPITPTPPTVYDFMNNPFQNPIVNFATQVTGVPINQISNNLLDTGSWRDAAPIVGGAIGRFLLNGGTAHNLITGLYSGPSGIGEAIWQCQSDAASVIDGPAGGWNYNVTAADGFSPGRGYQLAVWAFQTSFDADLYLGTGGGDGPSILNLDGSTNDNPYFWAGDLPQLGKWYLIVGIVHPSSTISMQSGISGVYDPETGVRVLAGTDFKCTADMTQIVHRGYQFYPTAPGVVTYFARPRVDEANGNQPNIAALMSSTALHNRNQLWDDIGGPNKAADNATKNIWRISPNDPGGSDGDGWKDTSTTPARFRLRLAGAYVDVSSLVTDTAQITDGAQLGLTALWSGVVGPDRPMDNATNDGYIDTRNVDEPPSFYRSTYRPKAFKDASVLAIPGAAAATFGALLTEADFGDASGGAVKQRFILGLAGAGVAYVRVSVSEAAWGTWMRDFNGFAPPLWNEVEDDGDKPANNADVTAAAFPDIDGNIKWTIDANAAGTITTGLPLPRRFKAMLGGVDVSSATSFAITTTGLVAATVNDTAGADRGIVTLGADTTGAGTISLTATFATGAKKNVVIDVTVNRAAMTSGGGAGATSGSVGTNANFSSTGFVAVTPEIQIMATAGGTVKAAFDASYTAAAGVTGRAQLRVAQTSGGGAVAQSPDTLGTAYIVNDEAGQVVIGETTYSGLTPSAPCFVQGFMRRSSGSGTVTPSGTLTAMQ